MLIELRGAIFGYEPQRPVVRCDALGAQSGKALGIFGPNGAGKTTLVRGIGGLLEPMQGSVERAPALNMGYLPQHRAIDLHWPMSGLDAALMATSARQPLGWVRGKGQFAVREMMRSMGVGDLAGRAFARLSGGQQQRILLAGAMAAEPQVLLLDEPTDGLDVHSRRALLDLLRQFTRNGLAIVVISHDVEDLMYLCDAVAWIHPADVPDHPSHVQLVDPAELARHLAGSQRGGA